MNKIILYTILIYNTALFAQVKNDTLYIKSQPCSSIEEISRRNKDEIEVIFLFSKNLRTIPNEVISCNNLIYLDLSNIESEDGHLTELNKLRRKRVEKIIQKNKNKIIDDPGIKLFHPNKIRKIPEEFFKLKNLRLIVVTGNAMSKKVIKKIRKKMPNCYILTDSLDEDRLPFINIKIPVRTDSLN